MAEQKARAVAQRPPMPQLERRFLQPRAGSEVGSGSVWEASGLGGQAPNSMWPANMPFFPWETLTGQKETPAGQRIARRDHPWSE